MYFFRTGSQQDPGAFAGSSSCGQDIIQQKDSLSPNFLTIQDPVSTQHIGPALCLACNTGLLTVVAYLF